MRATLGVILVMTLFSTLGKSQTNSYIFIFFNPNPNRKELSQADTDTLQARHMRNIRRLADEGKLLAAGPFEGGGGIFVFNTSTSDSVDDWLRTDPAFRAGRWTSEFYPYTPRVGSVRSVKGEVKMMRYTLISYKVASFDSTERNKRGLLAHERFVRKTIPVDSIVAEGSLGDGIGALLILRKGVKVKKLERERAIRDKSLLLIRRDLWIARGSFGEK